MRKVRRRVRNRVAETNTRQTPGLDPSSKAARPVRRSSPNGPRARHESQQIRQTRQRRPGVWNAAIAWFYRASFPKSWITVLQTIGALVDRFRPTTGSRRPASTRTRGTSELLPNRSRPSARCGADVRHVSARHETLNSSLYARSLCPPSRAGVSGHYGSPGLARRVHWHGRVTP